MIREGDVAPDFELVSSSGRRVKLSEYAGQKSVVLFFYPKDDSPGCTAQACSFRDAYDAFAEAGAEVIGISSDSAASHQAFGNKHRLPMTLLSDPNGQVRSRYGVGSTLGILPGRATFVIDKSGVVRHAFSSQLRVERHVKEALEVLERLSRGLSSPLARNRLAPA
ncbi:MAG TPA: peroxiredoxin [Labilithrix sp.]|nr:peroxiredoxin [Labilithrix sp.]